MVRRASGDDRGHVVGYVSGEMFRLSATIANAIPSGVGCAGSVGVPALRASDRPFLGSGCTLLVADSPALLSSTADANGTATFPFPIPSHGGLRGVTLHMQGAALDPLGSLRGFATVSNALVLVLGD